jgi:hypothetical protein
MTKYKRIIVQTQITQQQKRIPMKMEIRMLQRIFIMKMCMKQMIIMIISTHHA